ncbi:hypothetical protein N0A02_30225 [Paraburkholderia acidicola]|uniref:Uncharacterized protein n=1 Tax=Paraburkholderia acidicola TaxID=1912599 RepID=A0ABV1LWM8_9BURK
MSLVWADRLFMIAAMLAVCGSLGIALVGVWRPREGLDPRAVIRIRNHTGRAR